MKSKLIKFLKAWVLKKEREEWMKLYGFDNSCPHCQTWQGNCGGVAEFHRDYPNKNFDSYKCGNCKHWFVLRADTAIQVVDDDQKPGLELTIQELQRKVTANV